jgi:hypothetical protein
MITIVFDAELAKRPVSQIDLRFRTNPPLRTGCRRALCRNSMRRADVIELSGEVNGLIDRRCGKRLPAIDLAHVGLA